MQDISGAAGYLWTVLLYGGSFTVQMLSTLVAALTRGIQLLYVALFAIAEPLWTAVHWSGWIIFQQVSHLTDQLRPSQTVFIAIVLCPIALVAVRRYYDRITWPSFIINWHRDGYWRNRLDGSWNDDGNGHLVEVARVADGWSHNTRMCAFYTAALLLWCCFCIAGTFGVLFAMGYKIDPSRFSSWDRFQTAEYGTSAGVDMWRWVTSRMSFATHHEPRDGVCGKLAHYIGQVVPWVLN
jgi:hypothetical protein